MRKKTALALIICLFATSACGINESTPHAEPEKQTSGQGVETGEIMNAQNASDGDVAGASQTGKEEIEAFVFLDENDRKYLTPDSEDYRILYQELPGVTSFPGWAIEAPTGGALCYMGISGGTKNDIPPAWYVDVISYDESGNFLSEKQKLWVEREEDALTLMCSEKTCAYWFEKETGRDEVPDDFDPEATTLFCMDTILSRDVSEWQPDLEYVTRVGSAFYGETKRDGYDASVLASHVAYANVEVQSDRLAADFADQNGVIHTTLPYDYERDMDSAVRSVEYDYADCTAYYSMPENHKKSLIKGEGVHFDGSFPAEVYEDGFAKENEDGTYFIPATDDYFLYYIVGEGQDHNDMSVLLSFDEKGDPADLVIRKYRYVTNPIEEMIDGYVTMGGELLYSNGDDLFYVRMPIDPDVYISRGIWDDYKKDTKTNHLSDFGYEGGIFCPFRGQMPDCHAYLNKPGITADMMRIVEMPEFDPEEILGDLELPTEDYVVWASDGEEVDSYDGEQGKYYYPEHSYVIYFYDEDGSIREKALRVHQFAEEADAVSCCEEWKKWYLEEYAPEVYGNVMIYHDPDYDMFSRRTKQQLLSSLSTGYGDIYDGMLWFSIPYLTERQQEVYAESNWQ